jgi:flagellum-specific peptidoglycan hydrolase FlgJ
LFYFISNILCYICIRNATESDSNQSKELKMNHKQNASRSTEHFDSLVNGNGQPDQVLWKLLLISALAYIIWNDVSVTDTLINKFGSGKIEAGEPIRQTASFFTFGAEKPLDYGVILPKTAKSALAYAMDPGFVKRYDIPEEDYQAALTKLNAYTEQYAPAAIAEARAHGIPASITLAQGLLESGVGASRLATSSRNHFGIKCFSRTCSKGHCVNFTDDTHKDFFVKYQSVWESYRAHSRLLKQNGRYKPLFALNMTDYAGWARGLSQHGYATDPKYAQKLIAIIKTLKLDRFDRV